MTARVRQHSARSMTFYDNMRLTAYLLGIPSHQGRILTSSGSRRELRSGFPYNPRLIVVFLGPLAFHGTQAEHFRRRDGERCCLAVRQILSCFSSEKRFRFRPRETFICRCGPSDYRRSRMKSLLEAIFNSDRLTKPSFDVRSLVITFGIIIGIFIAIYAMTVDPNNTTATIGFPP
jgi:hypothetical protein